MLNKNIALWRFRCRGRRLELIINTEDNVIKGKKIKVAKKEIENTEIN
jgi:hypothetical protein